MFLLIVYLNLMHNRPDFGQTFGKTESVQWFSPYQVTGVTKTWSIHIIL